MPRPFVPGTAVSQRAVSHSLVHSATLSHYLPACLPTYLRPPTVHPPHHRLHLSTSISIFPIPRFARSCLKAAGKLHLFAHSKFRISLHHAFPEPQCPATASSSIIPQKNYLLRFFGLGPPQLSPTHPSHIRAATAPGSLGPECLSGQRVTVQSGGLTSTFIELDGHMFA